MAPVGSTVELRIRTTDRDGRSVAELSHGGMNLNQDLVVPGVAIAYRQYISDDDRQTYGHVQNEARLEGLCIPGMSRGVSRTQDQRSAQRGSDSCSPSGRWYTFWQIGSYAGAQLVLRQGQRYLSGDDDGESCKELQGVERNRPTALTRRENSGPSAYRGIDEGSRELAEKLTARPESLLLRAKQHPFSREG